jgi:hypothetical protein
MPRKEHEAPASLHVTLPIQGELKEEVTLPAELSSDWTNSVWVSDAWKDRPETILQLAEEWLDQVRDPGSWEADLQILAPQVTKNTPGELCDFEMASAVEGRAASKGMLEATSFLGMNRPAVSSIALRNDRRPRITLKVVREQTFHKPPLLDAAFLFAQEADRLAGAHGGSLDRRSLVRFALNAAQLQILTQKALIAHKDALRRLMKDLENFSEESIVAQRLRAARTVLGERRDNSDYALAVGLTLLGSGGLRQALTRLDAHLRAA